MQDDFQNVPHTLMRFINRVGYTIWNPLVVWDSRHIGSNPFIVLLNTFPMFYNYTELKVLKRLVEYYSGNKSSIFLPI